ncbi:MAG: polysaccharide biosynthesis tyrosine autokinase [Taibaiella sp.]|nr:polysaccharide biosynthesis tyrosine autokinase [Taibaiella sp.]
MQDQNLPRPNTEEQSKEPSVNLHKIVGALLSNLPWFVGFVILAFIIAFLYLRYATPMYQINAEIIIKEEKNEGLSNEAVLKELGVQTGEKNINNEMRILSSREIMTRVVKDLHLNIRYMIPGRVAQADNYDKNPFVFLIPPSINDSIIRKYEYKLRPIGTDSYTISYGKNKITSRWNDSISLPLGRIMIAKTGLPFIGNAIEYTITINSIDNTVNGCLRKLTVLNKLKSSSILVISFNDPIPKRGENLINKLIEEYQIANVNDKNEIANNTMNFINERLLILNGELTGVEKQIVDYKRENNLIDITKEGSLLMQSTQQYTDQLSQQEVQLNLIQSLENFIENNKYDKKVIPATLISQGTTFSGLISSYNQLRQHREELLLTTTENNPMVVSIDKQLDNLKQDLKLSIASVKRDLNVRIQQLRKREGFYSTEANQLPGKEREMLSYTRQQAIKQELYLLLLKKREETAIGKSTTIANSRVIEAARSAGSPYAPVRSMAFLIALLAGLGIPGIGIYIKNLLNTRIKNRGDISNNTSLSIAGEIGHDEGENTLVVKPGSRSVIAEQFRGLRTNLEFLLPPIQGGKVVMLTSSMSGEGKSFLSLNLASTLALSGKKVVLMELDLRKPKISKYLSLDNNSGFSNFAIGQLTYNDILIPSGVQDNLFIIPSGPIPPNPSELIILPEIANLFTKLRQDFDYIVVDTAPIGFVTDSQLLSRYADASLYVVRQGYTFKQQVQLADELYRTQKMPRMSLVVNDVKASRGYGYGYGYGYYSYGYGYGSYGSYGGYFDDKKQSSKGLRGIFDRLTKRNKKD